MVRANHVRDSGHVTCTGMSIIGLKSTRVRGRNQIVRERACTYVARVKMISRECTFALSILNNAQRKYNRYVTRGDTRCIGF